LATAVDDIEPGGLDLRLGRIDPQTALVAALDQLVQFRTDRRVAGDRSAHAQTRGGQDELGIGSEPGAVPVRPRGLERRQGECRVGIAGHDLAHAVRPGERRLGRGGERRGQAGRQGEHRCQPQCRSRREMHLRAAMRLHPRRERGEPKGT
jgi:hypothetical protein